MPTAWLAYVVPALLIATRLSGLMLTAPFFGSDGAPARIRAGLVIALTALLLPITHTALPTQSLLAWFGDGISELVIGALLGLVMQVVFEAAQLAGGVIAFQMGLSLESSIDPTTQADSTVMATFHNLVVLYLFLQMGVHRWILMGLTSSFLTLPLGSSLAALNGRQLLEFSGSIFVWGLELALPILIATLLIDVTLGFFAKVAPQLPVIFVGIPVKEIVGYTVLIGAIRFWPGLFSHQFTQAMQYFLQHARPLA